MAVIVLGYFTRLLWKLYIGEKENIDIIDKSYYCLTQNDIGWRVVSRKLLLFSTDAGFHFAGDGKVCYKNEPFPECCLTQNATLPRLQHYPECNHNRPEYIISGRLFIMHCLSVSLFSNP